MESTHSSLRGYPACSWWVSLNEKLFSEAEIGVEIIKKKNEVVVSILVPWKNGDTYTYLGVQYVEKEDSPPICDSEKALALLDPC